MVSGVKMERDGRAALALPSVGSVPPEAEEPPPAAPDAVVGDLGPLAPPSMVPLAAVCCFWVVTGLACKKIGPQSALLPSTGTVLTNSRHCPSTGAPTLHMDAA